MNQIRDRQENVMISNMGTLRSFQNIPVAIVIMVFKALRRGEASHHRLIA
jgi:hypothetical protein